jgi:hypothetical protein
MTKSTNLDLKSSEKVLFVGTIQNSRRPPWPLIGRDILESFSRTFACHVNRLARNIPYGVVGLRNELKYQNSAPAYDWLRHDLLLRNNPSDLPEMGCRISLKRNNTSSCLLEIYQI